MKPTMKFGALFLFFDPLTFVENCRLAEKLGFDHLWVGDTQLLERNVYAYMALCAVNTSRVKIGSNVTNPVTRHATVTAGAILTIDEISGGRAALGIGRGDSAVRVMGDQPSTIAELEEYIHLIRGLLSGKDTKYRGKKIKMRWSDGRKIPIYVAAYGPKGLSLAGRVADGVILQIADITVLKWCVKQIFDAARKAKRDPKKLEVISLSAFYADNDLAKARESVKWLPAAVSNHVLDALSRYPRSSLPHELTKDVDAFKGRYDYRRHFLPGAEHLDAVTYDMIDRFTVIGKIEHCIEKIRKMEEIGVTQFASYFTAHQLDHKHQTLKLSEVMNKL